MSQNYTQDCFRLYEKPANVTTNYFENNAAALKSNFSGSNSPPDPVSFKLWGDTTNKVLRYSSSGEWLGLMHGDASQIIWKYRNLAPDGWVLDTSVTDAVVAIRGGSYYTIGASVQGTWQAIDFSHSHRVLDNSGDFITGAGGFSSYNSSGTLIEPAVYNGALIHISVLDDTAGDLTIIQPSSATTTFYTSIDGGLPATWRPRAFVGTLQYLDI
jgi:hypothetical protein